MVYGIIEESQKNFRKHLLEKENQPTIFHHSNKTVIPKPTLLTEKMYLAIEEKKISYTYK